MSGRTLGFGGRILTNDKAAKNTSIHRRLIFTIKVKSALWVYHAAIIAKQLFFSCQYTDVIQFHQSGVKMWSLLLEQH
jgi:DNA primase